MAHKISDFLNDMKLCDLGEKKLNNLNSPKRIPIFFLIDNSSSMSMMADKISNTVNRIISTLYKDKQVQISADIYILTFNGRVTILNDQSPISKNYKLDIDYNGVSFLGLGLKTVLDFIETKKIQYKQSTPTIKFHIPILFVFSDGYSYCDDKSFCFEDQMRLNYSVNKLHKLVSLGRLCVFSFAIGKEYDKEVIRNITGLEDYSHVFRIEQDDNWFVDFQDFIFVPE